MTLLKINTQRGGRTQVKSQDEDQAEMTQVGFEFKPGLNGNLAIELLLGHESEEFAGMIYRKVTDNPSLLNWEPCPDYSNDDVHTIEMLEERGVTVFVLHSLKAGKTKSIPQYIAIFETDGTMFGTVAFESESQAAACALWWVLGSKS